MGDRKNHPTGPGSPKDPRYLLNTAVPTQQVGELMQSARSVGLEGTLSKRIKEKKTRRY